MSFYPAKGGKKPTISVHSVSFNGSTLDDGNYRGHLDVSVKGLGTDYVLNKTAFVVCTNTENGQANVGSNISYSIPSNGVLRISVANRNAVSKISGNVYLIDIT